MRRALCLLLLVSCGHSSPPPPPPPPPAEPDLRDPRETHLADLRRLTFGGENAEAYWSSDGTELVMQSTHGAWKCDQIFRLPSTGGDPILESTGAGRTTCSYFYPGDRRILFASTHHVDAACPPEPDHSQGYVWALYDYDIFQKKIGSSELVRLTESAGYDAEATICPTTGEIVFTSVRDGDLELYKMDPDGKNVVRLTNAPGYDGGAFFSRDCKQLVWRASRPQGAELEDYQRLLARGLVRPTKLEIWVADADGQNARQVTYLGAASFAPYFFPDGKRIIFSSNALDPKGREFDLFAVNVDGSGLERITFTPGFDGFPMFSPDGRMLSFSSNRANAEGVHDTDVYVARWVDGPPQVEARAADRWLADARWLADDAREGRGVGTRGLDEAADWLAARFAELGAEPGLGKEWKQAFEVPVKVTRAAESSLAIDGVAVAPEDWVAPGWSASAEVAADVVVAGHGVTAKDLGHDDYAKVKAKGKIVVVRRYTPEGGRFDDDRAQRRYGDLRYKAWNAREHGAVGLIVVDLPVTRKGDAVPDEAELPPLGVDVRGDAGIPVVVAKRAAAAALFGPKKHAARIAVKLVVEKRPAYNVVARIPAGAAEKLPGAVVVGAHYDHLGRGGPASLAPGVDAVHNGADDNASGTAGLLEVARALVARRSELRRDVWLIAFSGEEWGVLGSGELVRRPPAGLAIADVVAMLNMDMIGRLRGNKLSVLGAESAKEWPELVAAACARAGIACATGGDGYGPSDHISFYTAGVPVLFFFTGAHDDYHKPTDDAERLNAAGGAQIAALVADIAAELTGRERLTFQASPAREPGGDVRSFGASLGTVPDYSGSEGKEGVLLAGVRAGGPAEQAGLRRGDLLVQIGKHPIRNVEDLMFVLRNARPGETTTVVVVREGQRVERKVTFGKSARTR